MTHIANCMRSFESTPNVSMPLETLTAVRISTEHKSPRPDKRRSRLDRLGSPASLRQAVYQLWPSLPSRSSVDVTEISQTIYPSPTDRAMALETTRSPTSLSDSAVQFASEQTRSVSPFTPGDLYRRRKISVPELSAAMTTVQEHALDSPTIPGRPPLYKSVSDYALSPERCSSAPGNTWREGPFGDALMSCVTGPAPLLATRLYAQGAFQTKRPLSPILSPPITSRPVLKVDTDSKVPEEQEDTPPKPPPKSPTLEKKLSLAALHKAQTSMGKSASPTPSKARHTPVLDSRHSPNLPVVAGLSPHRVVIPPTMELRGSPTNLKDIANLSKISHNRNMSDTGVLDRGRPPLNQSRQRSRTCSESAKLSVADHWQMPTGTRLSEASISFAADEKAILRKQSMDQAEKFAVLKKREVAELSRDLRSIDERCDYLRRTYKSLREGRQKLHSRMISYLKRTDTITFSRESLLKQEEALSDLDHSIDDFILKLEQAENKRLRIRQKLLEHVAAALLLNPSGFDILDADTPPRSPVKIDSPTSIERRELESIKVYADSQALDLFTDIENAIGQMCETAY